MEKKFNDRIPIYVQIMDLIKIDIVTKKLKTGDKLPSVREMSSSLNVNPNTIQRAYQELEREKLTYTQRGTGNFVMEDSNMVVELKKEMAKRSINVFIEDMKTLGLTSEEIMDTIRMELNKGGNGNGISIEDR